MPKRHNPRRFANQRARDKFASDVRIEILRLGTASEIRKRFRVGLFNQLKSLIRPHFITYIKSLEQDVNYDDWCEENIPGIIEEIHNSP